MMRTTLAIAAAGATGVLARHTVQHLVPRAAGVPWGTLAVNVSGAFVMGLLFTLLARRFSMPMWIQEAILIGLLGGYTTFSAVSLEAYLMIEHHRYGLAFGYVAGTVVGGLVALFLGIHLARSIA